MDVVKTLSIYHSKQFAATLRLNSLPEEIFLNICFVLASFGGAATQAALTKLQISLKKLSATTPEGHGKSG